MSQGTIKSWFQTKVLDLFKAIAASSFSPHGRRGRFVRELHEGQTVEHTEGLVPKAVAVKCVSVNRRRSKSDPGTSTTSASTTSDSVFLYPSMRLSR